MARERIVFHLDTKDTSYIMSVLPTGHLQHLYYGKRLRRSDNYRALERHQAFYCWMVYDRNEPDIGLEQQSLEYSTLGRGDYREPALELAAPDGSFTCDFLYKEFREYTGAKPVAGLPSALGGEADCRTLEIDLYDEVLDVTVTLSYGVYYNYNVITRNATVKNGTKGPLSLKRVMSMQLDFTDSAYEFTTFDGNWAMERIPHRRPVSEGIIVNDSKFGSSSARHNPLVLLQRPNTTETFGECYGCNLVYSGNHYEAVEVNPFGQTRLVSGLGISNFCWRLEKGESFASPQAVLTYSAEGLGRLSQQYHAFINEYIVRGYWKGRERPVLINNWEGTYFDFDEQKLVHMAREAAQLGVELFVMDDGWFGERKDDLRGLGDWWVNKGKLPNGLEGLAQKINELGMLFGLWVEPEMVNENSELYEKHPNWAIKIPGRDPALSRWQLILDFTRKDVRDYIVGAMTKVFSSAPISYVKWDMNRPMSDVYSKDLPAERQGEFYHRYMLGLYDVLARLTQAFPQILFESCSGGGNRFDLGWLCFAPQTWTSDNTDAICRLDIQEGTSFGYPLSTMGAHVSAVPNHQTGRMAPLETRFNVAAFGCLGYELDVTKLRPAEKQAVQRQIAFYKQHRRLFQYGTFYRVENPQNRDKKIWAVVSEDRREALVGFYQLLAHPTMVQDRLRVEGLDSAVDYTVTARPQGLLIDELLGRPLGKMEEYQAGGDILQYAGLLLRQRKVAGEIDQFRIWSDFGSQIYYIRAK